MGHRPMYCTNVDEDDCTKFDDRVTNSNTLNYKIIFK